MAMKVYPAKFKADTVALCTTRVNPVSHPQPLPPRPPVSALAVAQPGRRDRRQAAQGQHHGGDTNGGHHQ